jgi:hypothetical protein
MMIGFIFFCKCWYNFGIDNIIYPAYTITYRHKLSIKNIPYPQNKINNNVPASSIAGNHPNYLVSKYTHT